MLIAAEKPRIPTVEEGVYNVVCTGIIDQGMQVNEKFKNTSQKVRLIFELIGETYELNEEEHTRQVGRDFTLSLGEKSNLRAFLQSWRGKAFTSEELNGFDLKNILGKAGQLQIIHKEGENGTYAYLNTMLPLPKGTVVPKPENRLVYFDMSDPETYGEFEMFPDFLKERISAAENFEETGLGTVLDDDEEERAVAKTAAAPKATPKAATQKAAAESVPVEEFGPDDDLSFEVNAAA